MKKLGVMAASLAGMLALSFSPSTAEAAEFKDVSDDFWAEGSIEYLAEEGIINGYPDGTFRPNQPISRSQAAAMMVSALNLDTSGRPDAEFSDVSDNNARKHIIDTVNDEGILRGSGDVFRPAEHITRAQMAAVMRRGFELENSQEELFTDVPPDYWSFTDISTIAANGIASGYEDGTFQPGNNTTRAQFSVFLRNALDPERESSEPPSPTDNDVKRGVYVTENGWTYSIQDHELVRTNADGDLEYVLLRKDIGEDYSCDCGDNPAGDGYATREGTQLLLHDGWIYYMLSASVNIHSGKDAFELYRVRTDGSGKEQVLGRNVQAPYIYDGNLYYFSFKSTFDPEEASLMKADLDGSNAEKMKSLTMNERNFYFNRDVDQYYVVQYDDEYVYYSTDQAVYRTNLRNGQEERIHGRPATKLHVTADRIVIGTEDGLYSLHRDTGKKSKIKDDAILDMIAFGDVLYILSDTSLYQWDLDAENMKTLEENFTTFSHDRNNFLAENKDGDGFIYAASESRSVLYLMEDGHIKTKDLKNARYLRSDTDKAGDMVFLKLNGSGEPENTLVYAINTTEGTIQSHESKDLDGARTLLAEEDHFIAAPYNQTGVFQAIVYDGSKFEEKEWDLPFEKEVTIYQMMYRNGTFYANVQVREENGTYLHHILRLNREIDQLEVIYETDEPFDMLKREAGGFYIFQSDRGMTVEIIDNDGNISKPQKEIGGYAPYTYNVEQRGDTVYVYSHGVKVSAAYPISLLEK